MAYATLDDAKTKYGENYVLTSVTRDDEPDLAAFDTALDTATSTIDSYVGSRYPIPLDPVPSIVAGYCIDIAIYLASSTAGTHTDEKRLRYEDAIDWLKAVAAGKAIISVLNDDGVGIDKDEVLPVMKASPRLFTRRTMRGLV